MADSPSKRRYDADNTKMVSIKLNKKTDADIIEYLEASGNKQGKIKAGIRLYMEMEEKMTRYWLIEGDVDITKSNASKIFDDMEEAIESANNFKTEILNGVYDAEWDIEESERETFADAVAVYKVLYSDGGSIRSKIKIL